MFKTMTPIQLDAWEHPFEDATRERRPYIMSAGRMAAGLSMNK